MQELSNLFWFLGNFSEVSLNVKEAGYLQRIEVISDIITNCSEIEKVTIDGSRGKSMVFSFDKHGEILKRLSESIRTSVSLTAIEISKIYIIIADNVAGLNNTLDNMLPEHCNLEELSLSILKKKYYIANIGMRNEGAIALANVLKKHTSLSQLNLRNLFLFIKEIIVLGENEIGDEGIVALAHALGNHNSLTQLILGLNYNC